MTIETKIAVADGVAVLTTEHAASSYGQPVVCYAGQVYGPADRLPYSACDSGAAGYPVEGCLPDGARLILVGNTPEERAWNDQVWAFDRQR